MATRAYPAAVALTLALFLVPFTANAQDIGDDEEEDPPPRSRKAMAVPPSTRPSSIRCPRTGRAVSYPTR